MASISLFEVVVVARQPLFLRSAPRAGNRQSTSVNISGSTLRGAFAALWLADHDQPDPVFYELFDTGVVWPTLRPQGHVVVPMSVRRCKYRSKPLCFTIAVDTFASESTADASQGDIRCPHCAGPLELSKGDLVATDPLAPANTITRTSVELDHDETAKDGQLFSRDALSSGTRLDGRAPLPTLLSPEAKKWLDGLAGRRIRVGGRRSVAGTVTIDRIAWPTLPAPDATAIGQQVALCVETPTVVLDHYGATTTQPDQLLRGTVLEGLLRVLASSSFVRPETVGGWNALAGLPRPEDTAWAAGSTVIAEVTHPTGISSDLWARFIASGVGTRRAEGLGVVTTSSQAWAFPAIAAVPKAAAARTTSGSSLLLDLVTDLNSADRKDTADWLAGRLTEFARKLRRINEVDRVKVATAALNEHRLRNYSATLVDAYYDSLADPANTPDDLERLSRLMSLLSLPEFMQEST